MNRTLIFPKSINVDFSDGAGPQFEPDNNTITMSNEFLYRLARLYMSRYPHATDEALQQFIIRSSTFLFYHEVAHSLISEFDLPIVSNEETAADNLAVIIALEYTNDGYDITMDSAELFGMLDQLQKSYQADDLWDEHSLDAQRFYNILCLTYGKYPDKVTAELKRANNVKLLSFINEKSDHCKEEYQHQMHAWLQLLSPYIRKN